MKLTKRQLKRIIREEKQKLQESEYIPYGQPGYDPDAEDERMEKQGRDANAQLAQTLQYMHGNGGMMPIYIAEAIVEVLQKCDDGETTMKKLHDILENMLYPE